MSRSRIWSLFGRATRCLAKPQVKSSASSIPSSRSTAVRRRRLKCELLETRRVLATFAVDTTNDSVAVDLVTGLDVNGNVSIRSAIMAANSQPGNHVINVPFSANPYQLFIGGQAKILPRRAIWIFVQLSKSMHQRTQFWMRKT